MGQILRGNKSNLTRLKINAALMGAFATGGYLAFHVVNEYASQSLLFSAAFYTLFGLYLMIL
jgi:hypothetical protein